MFQCSHLLRIRSHTVSIDKYSPKRDFRLMEMTFIEVEGHARFFNDLENRVKDAIELSLVFGGNDHVIMDHMNFRNASEQWSECFRELS